MKLSLDAFGKVAEIVGSIGVVVGILFVGFQIRDNTIAQQFATTQLLISEYNLSVAPLNDTENVCMFIEASRDFNSISQKDKVRFSVLMQPVFRNHEQLFYSNANKIIDPNVYAGFQGHFAAILQLPGVQQWWGTRRNWFGVPFQKHVDTIISKKHSVDPANFESADFELKDCQ